MKNGHHSGNGVYHLSSVPTRVGDDIQFSYVNLKQLRSVETLLLDENKDLRFIVAANVGSKLETSDKLLGASLASLSKAFLALRRGKALSKFTSYLGKSCTDFMDSASSSDNHMVNLYSGLLRGLLEGHSSLLSGKLPLGTSDSRFYAKFSDRLGGYLQYIDSSQK